jgi:glycosyltransferase involved in cell wall biosynthesis
MAWLAVSLFGLVISVAIDSTALLGKRSGVGEFVYHLLEGLVTEDCDVAAFAISLRRRHMLAGQLPDGVKAVAPPMPARPLFKGWYYADLPKVDALFRGFDVIHGTNFVVPPARKLARVVTVHDLTPVLYPEYCDPSVLVFPRFIERAVRSGVMIHTPSNFVRLQLIEHFRADPERVAVAHLGASQQVPDRLDPVEGLSNFILFLSTVEPRKGICDLIEAFDLVNRVMPEVTLVVAGQRGWNLDRYDQLLRSAGCRGRVVELGYVSDARRRWLLKQARCLVFPSHYEGFGLPVLEAMASGTPVIATSAGAIPEVAGDAAWLVDPANPEQLASAILELLANEDLINELREKGRVRFRTFSWQRMAKEMVAIYQRALA